MILYYTVPVIAGTYFKTYVAEVMGEDPKYKLRRKFLDRERVDLEKSRLFICDIGRHGVFEQRIRRFRVCSNALISDERRWFIYYHRKTYDIDYEDVVFSLFNLEAQYKKRSKSIDVLPNQIEITA